MRIVIRRTGRIVANAEVCGTLAERDGIKTGPGCPNGQDAYDGKVVVVSRRMDFIGGGQLNEATMPTAEVSRTLNCMHEAGRILVTNSNLGHVMPTLTLDLCRMTGKQQADAGGCVMARAEGLSRLISSRSTVGRQGGSVAFRLNGRWTGSFADGRCEGVT